MSGRVVVRRDPFARCELERESGWSGVCPECGGRGRFRYRWVRDDRPAGGAWSRVVCGVGCFDSFYGWSGS